MKDEKNLIHLKIDYSESKDAKKSLLSSEINLLQMNKAIQNYQKLRQKELETKKIMGIKLNEAQNEIIKLTKLLPELKIPKILKRESKINTEYDEKIEKYGTIEEQLKEIQTRLKQLEEH